MGKDFASELRKTKPLGGKGGPQKKLSDADIAEIRKLKSEGYSAKQIAAACGVSAVYVYQIVNGRARRSAGE
jgi:transposase